MRARKPHVSPGRMALPEPGLSWWAGRARTLYQCVQTPEGEPGTRSSAPHLHLDALCGYCVTGEVEVVCKEFS